MRTWNRTMWNRMLGLGLLLAFVGLTGCKKKTPKPDKVKTLIQQLKADDASQRKAAAAQLGALGVKAKAAIPALAAALKDDDNDVRYAAARALGQTRMAHPQVAVGALSRALKDSDVEMRITAAKALGNMGMAAIATVGILRAMERDPDEDPRVKAAVKTTLRKIK